MAFCHKILEMQRRTAAIREQYVEQAAATLQVRTCTKLLNDAARCHSVILRQHQIVCNNPHSINNT